MRSLALKEEHWESQAPLWMFLWLVVHRSLMERVFPLTLPDSFLFVLSFFSSSKRLSSKKAARWESSLWSDQTPVLQTHHVTVVCLCTFLGICSSQVLWMVWEIWIRIFWTLRIGTSLTRFTISHCVPNDKLCTHLTNLIHRDIYVLYVCVCTCNVCVF